jgi:hypothetical protein
MGDDLVDYYRRLAVYPHVEPAEMHVRVVRQSSPEGSPLAHFNVERCLRAVPLSVQECLAQERVEQVLDGHRVINILGILKLCLLGCTPFLGVSEHQVKDVRPHVPDPRKRIQDCPERPALFDGLAAALATYHHVLSVDTWSAYTTERDQGLAFLETTASLLTEIRRRKIPLEDPRLRRHRVTSLIRALQWAAEITWRIQPADEYHAGGIRPPGPSHHTVRAHKRLLVWDMISTFRTFRPSTFTQDAMYHALAAILTPLAIYNDRGKDFTPANLKRLGRRQP